MSFLELAISFPELAISFPELANAGRLVIQTNEEEELNRPKGGSNSVPPPIHVEMVNQQTGYKHRHDASLLSKFRASSPDYKGRAKGRGGDG